MVRVARCALIRPQLNSGLRRPPRISDSDNAALLAARLDFVQTRLLNVDPASVESDVWRSLHLSGELRIARGFATRSYSLPLQVNLGVDMTGLVSRSAEGHVAWGSIDGESC